MGVMQPEHFHEKIAEIETLMRERFRIRKPDLDQQIRKAGRLLPYKIRKDMAVLSVASMLIQSPKLARRVEATRIEPACERVVDYLKTVDPAERRKDRILGFLGILAANFLVVLVVVVVVLRWRGLV